MLIYETYSMYYLTGVILIGTLYVFYGYLSNMGNAFNTFAYLYGDIVRVNARIRGAKPLDEEYGKLEKKPDERLPKRWKEMRSGTPPSSTT